MTSSLGRHCFYACVDGSKQTSGQVHAFAGSMFNVQPADIQYRDRLTSRYSENNSPWRIQNTEGLLAQAGHGEVGEEAMCSGREDEGRKETKIANVSSGKLDSMIETTRNCMQGKKPLAIRLWKTFRSPHFRFQKHCSTLPLSNTKRMRPNP